MECLNKNAHAFYKVAEFKKPNLAKNSKIYQEKYVDNYQILALEETIKDFTRANRNITARASVRTAA